MSFFKSILISVLIIINLSSCTFDLWKKTQYEENLKNFYINKDGKKIVILGEKYHYVFNDESGELNNLLLWESKSKLEIENYDLRISKFSKISGSITVKTKTLKESNNKLSNKEKSFLQNSGFTNSDSNSTILKKKIDISGNRYTPKSLEKYNFASSLNQEQKLNIEVADYADKTKKIVLTPVAIVADSLMITLFLLTKH
jgi:hypothetical protein